MRSAILSVCVVVICLSAFGWLLFTTPAPYSDEHRAFTPKDQRLLERDYPGGVFKSATLYIWCQPRKDNRWGDTVLMHSDGRTIWPNQTCWRWPRE